MKISKNIVLKGKILNFDTPRVMTIINITPDSFFEGSRASSSDDILRSVERAVAEGASLIDIGGYSTRPNAAFVSEAEEIHRVTSALEVIRRNYADLPVSVDTFRARVAEIAVGDYEADIINDVSGGTLDDNMLPTMAKLNVPYILMHMRGTPQTMAQMTDYDDIVADVLKYFAERIDTLRQLGYCSDIILDLGFGFAKTTEQNYKLLANQRAFECFELPILTGISRKSMINRVIDTTPQEALNGTTVLNTLALLGGADILRVHDTRQAMEAIKLVEYYRAASQQ